MNCFCQRAALVVGIVSALFLLGNNDADASLALSCASHAQAGANGGHDRGWFQRRGFITAGQCWHLTDALAAAHAELPGSKPVPASKHKKSSDQAILFGGMTTARIRMAEAAAEVATTARVLQQPINATSDSVFKSRWVDLPQASLATELQTIGMSRFKAIPSANGDTLLMGHIDPRRGFSFFWELTVGSALIVLFSAVAIGLYGWIGFAFVDVWPISRNVPDMRPFRVSEIRPEPAAREQFIH